MRISEFLAEAGLALSNFQYKNNHYWKNLLNLIKTGAEIQLTDGTTVQIASPSKVLKDLKSIWTGDELATPDQVAQLKKVALPTVDGRLITISKIFKSTEIKTGSASGKEEEKFSKFWNLGNVVEGIMGAAVTAKFINADKQVDWRDIVAVLRKMAAQEAAPEPEVKKGKKKATKLTQYMMSTKVTNDNLSFLMSLNPTDFKALEMSYLDANTLQQYPDHQEIFKAYENAAEYVNTSNTVQTAINRVREDKRSNTILIESEGASAEKQTSTKADLFITVDGTRERLLSLKAKTVPQVGQVSGHAFENLEQFFKSTLGFGLPNEFEKMFPKGTYKEVGPKIWEKAFPKAYKHMFNALSETLSGNNDYKEYDFVKQIYEAVKHHATLGEDVIIVYLSPSSRRSYTELKIGNELFEALKNFDLYPVMAGPTKIRIMGKPVTPEGERVTGGKDLDFVQLRSFEQKGVTIRNVVEIQSLFKALTDVTGVVSRTIEPKQKPEVAKPTVKKAASATAPKPALKVSQQKIGAPATPPVAKKAVGTIGSK